MKKEKERGSINPIIIIYLALMSGSKVVII